MLASAGNATPRRHQEDHDRGLRPHRHRPGLRVRLLRHAGLQGAARGGVRGRAPQLQPRHHHDRPGVRRPDLRRAAHPGGGRADPGAREARRAAAHPGRPDRAQPGGGAGEEWRAGAARGAAHRRLAGGHREGRGPAALQAGHAADGRGDAQVGLRHHLRGGAALRRGDRLPHHPAPLLHHGWRGRRRRLQPRGVRGDGAAGAAALPHPHPPRRGVDRSAGRSTSWR